MTSKVLIAGLLLPLCSLAKSELTFPEFECTAVEIKDSIRVIEVLGKSKFPSVSLRRYVSGEWEFKRKGSSSRLNTKEVLKSEKYLKDDVTYEIQESGTFLKFVLKGTSPSRTAQLWELTNTLARSRLLARLTCH